MRNLIVVLLVLNISLGFCATTQQNVEQGKALFAKLKSSSDIGKNLVDTIALELSTAQNDDQTIVSKVIEMLIEVQRSLENQQEDFQEEVDSKDEECHGKLDELKGEISDLDDRIGALEDVLPLRRDEWNLKTEQQEAVEDELHFYEAELVRVIQQSEERRAEFEESRDEHTQMIATLTQAKRLIAGLKNVEFLQQSSFAQVKGHFETSLSSLQAPHNRSFVKFLMQMTAVADQEQVQNLLDIIDSLIAQVEETQGVEASAEQARVTRFQNDRERMQQNITNSDAELKDLIADAKTAETRYTETQQELESQIQTQDAKKEQLQDRERVCADNVSALNSRIANYQDILDIIDQVITLLTYSSIQGAQQMMSDYDSENYTAEGEGEESYLGEYSTDEGVLPSRDNTNVVGSSDFVQKKQSFLRGYDPLDH